MNLNLINNNDPISPSVSLHHNPNIFSKKLKPLLLKEPDAALTNSVIKSPIGTQYNFFSNIGMNPNIYNKERINELKTLTLLKRNEEKENIILKIPKKLKPKYKFADFKNFVKRVEILNKLRILKIVKNSKKKFKNFSKNSSIMKEMSISHYQVIKIR